MLVVILRKHGATPPSHTLDRTSARLHVTLGGGVKNAHKIEYYLIKPDNCINGKNLLLEIGNFVSVKFEPIPVEWEKDFFGLLKKADIIL